MDPVEAMRIVAARVAHNRVTDAYEEWEAHPLIGERDWEEIVDHYIPLLLWGDPSAAEYNDAISVLAARAENE